MTSFKDRSFAERFTVMGDLAEETFEEHYPPPWDRLGHNRPSSSMRKWPAMLRYMPDYVTSNEFVEVQGVGRDQVFKLKLDKLAALGLWNKVFPVVFFVFDSYHQRHLTVPLGKIPLSQAILGAFPEGKEYWAVPLQAFPEDAWIELA